MRLLLIEDDPELADGLQQSLGQSGYSVDAMRSAEAGRAACASTEYALLILDLGLPDGDGLALLRELRAQGIQSPVLILTARGELGARIAGLDAGGDDYLAKPFALGELEARVRALLRRGTEATSIVRLGGLAYDSGTRQVLIDGVEPGLTPREFAVLEALLRRPGVLVSKEQLFESLYSWDSDSGISAVEVYISRLRRKLQPAGLIIRMFRGLGYRLDLNDGNAAS